MTNTTKYILALTCYCVFATTLYSNAARMSPVCMISDMTDVPSDIPVVSTDSTASEPAYVINFNVYEQNQTIYCNFRTEFKCRSYAIEGKQAADDEFKSLFYCNDKLCVDSREWVDISFANHEYPFRYFRIKTIMTNGDVHYSQIRYIHLKSLNEVEIVNSVVSSHLYFRFNTASIISGYNYSIAAVNGELIRNNEPVAEGFANLETLPAGFYIISFNSGNGKCYHYKFLKTANL
jgi:hypothetical protein